MGTIRLLLCGLACIYGETSTANTFDEKPDTTRPASRDSDKDLYGDPLPEGAVARLGTVRFRYPGRIAGMCFSNDGRALLTGSGKIQLWNLATGRRTREIDGRCSRGLLLSSNGKLLADVGSAGAVVYLRDAETGALLHKFGAEPPFGTRLAAPIFNSQIDFSRDGKMLATAIGPVKIWDTTTGHEICTLAKEVFPLFPDRDRTGVVAFASDGRTVVWSAGTDTINLWDVKEKKALGQLPERQVRLQSLTFSRDGRLLATGSDENADVRIWNFASRKKVQTIRAVGSWLAFSPDAKGIFVGDDDHGLALFDVGTGRVLRRFEENASWLTTFAVSRDGALLAAASNSSRTIKLWHVATGRRLGPNGGHATSSLSACFSPDGGRLVSTGSDAMRLWDCRQGCEIRTFVGPPGRPIGIAWSPDGKIVASADATNPPRLWDPGTGKELRKMSFDMSANEESDSCNSPPSFSANGDLLAARDRQGKVCVWEVASGRLLRRFGEANHSDNKRTFAQFVPNRNAIVTGGCKLAVQLWDVETGKLLQRFGDLGESCIAAALSPDARFLAAGESHQACVWDLAGGRQLLKFAGCAPESDGMVYSVAYSPDSRMIVIGDGYSGYWRPSNISLWESATGRERYRFAAASGPRLVALALSSDGRTIASVDDMDNILIWDVFATARDAGAPDVDRCWKDLVDANAALGFRAAARLIRNPAQAVPFLAVQLKAAARLDQDHVSTLVRQLDDAKFAIREAATRELEKLGETAGEPLREALKGTPSPELKRRAQMLMDKIDSSVPSGETLRGIRAIEVLEYIGTAEARKLLRELATCEPAARLTREAKASISRIETRKAGKP